MIEVIVAIALQGLQAPEGAMARVVLVAERTNGGTKYSCDGHPIDPNRVLTAVEKKLDSSRPSDTPIFVLFEDQLSLNDLFELGSLLAGKAGLRNIRYFAFSRKTGVMMEVSPTWERWKFKADGTLERKPW